MILRRLAPRRRVGPIACWAWPGAQPRAGPPCDWEAATAAAAPAALAAPGLDRRAYAAGAVAPRRPSPGPARRWRGPEDFGADGGLDELPGDILEGVPVEELVPDDGAVGSGARRAAVHETAGGSSGSDSAGPLARKMWNCAKRGVRAEEVWARFSQRALMTGAMSGAGDVALMFFAYARIKYRDTKVFDALSPLILQHIDKFTPMELALLMNAHKKLEYQRMDNMQLLLSALCNRRDEWDGRMIALAANAAAHFYIYQPGFWKSVAVSLPKLVWSMNPLELSNLVSAMARVDRRDTGSLLMISRMCRRCAKQNLFSQETLAIALNSFAKLDFNHPRLSRVFELAAITKLDRALEMGPDYRKSSLRDIDVFDVQSLVLLLQAWVCLVGTSDETIEKVLILISWSRKEVSDFQRRTLKTTCIILRRQYAALCRRLPHEVRNALYEFEKAPVKMPTFEPRWQKELRFTLRKMDISAELKAVVDDQVLDIFMPANNAVICAIGPYGYYANSTHRTAYSKLHQRVLEAEGYKCMVVPYYEWAELQTEEDKMVYLWSMGRRAAAQGRAASDDAAPSVVSDGTTSAGLRSDLSDLGEARL